MTFFVIGLTDRTFSCSPLTSLILTAVANSRPTGCHFGISWVITVNVHRVTMLQRSTRPTTNAEVQVVHFSESLSSLAFVLYVCSTRVKLCFPLIPLYLFSLKDISLFG